MSQDASSMRRGVVWPLRPLLFEAMSPKDKKIALYTVNKKTVPQDETWRCISISPTEDNEQSIPGEGCQS